MIRLGCTIVVLCVLVLTSGCAPTAPRRDVYWSGPPVASQSYPVYPPSRSQPPRQGQRWWERGRSSGYGSEDYERRRAIQEEDRRRAMAEREREADERKLKSAAQSQAQSSCIQAGLDRTLCRNAATFGSVLIP